MKSNVRSMNGHITSYEIKRLFDWLLENEKTRKKAVFEWTSGLARQIGYIVERYYRQTKKPDYPKYDEIFSTSPFMCGHCLDRMFPPKANLRSKGRSL